jgi:hypothetical protein
MIRSLLLAGWLLSSCALAGDFFPMPPKRVTYEFGPSGPNLPKSGALTIETTGLSLDACEITALSISVNDASITVPKSLLQELGTVNLTTLSFYTISDTFLTFEFQRPGGPMGTTIKGKYTLVIAKGKLTELRTEVTTQTFDRKTTTKKLLSE